MKLLTQAFFICLFHFVLVLEAEAAGAMPVSKVARAIFSQVFSF